MLMVTRTMLRAGMMIRSLTLAMGIPWGFLGGVIAAVLVGTLATTPAFAGGPQLTISTLPFDDAASQQAVFNVLSKHLSKSIDRKVVFEAGKTYDDVIAKLSTGKVDVAFLGAGAYIEARRTGGVRAILRTIRHRSTNYFGIVVVKQGSDIKSLSDLKGKRFAFVDKKSTAGYYFPRRLLRKAGINPDKDIEVVFAGGHHKVVQMVAAGTVDAGACFEGAQQNLADPDSVVPMARTEPILGDPVVVRPGLGADLIKTLRSALIELSTVPAARSFFTFSEIDAFVPAFDSDYDAIAELIRESGG